FLQLHPKNAQAYISRRIAKAHRGDPDAAIGDYNRALAVDSKYALAYLNRGVAKQVKGEIDSAIVDYDHALNINSKLADAYDDRGSAKANKGDLDGAIADLNRALQLDSKAASAYVIYVNRGTANFFGSQLDGCTAGLPTFLRVVATQSGVPSGHLADSVASR